MALKLSEGCFPAEIVGRAEAAGFALTETAYAGGARLPRHSHERACFVVVVRGAFEEVYEGKGRACGPLALIFRPPHEVHSDRFGAQGARCLNIEVDRRWLARVGAHSRVLEESAEFRGGAYPHRAAQLYREYRRMDELSTLAIESLLLEVVVEAARRPETSRARTPPPWLGRADEMIRAQFREPLSLGAVAAAAGVRPAHLSAAFRKSHGCTPGEYVRRLRVEFACRELSGSDAPIIKIALAAGFYDQSHFSRTFKRHTGMSPAAYRSVFRPS